MSKQAEPAINDDPGMPGSHEEFAALREAQLTDAIHVLHAEAWNYGLRQGLGIQETREHDLMNAEIKAKRAVELMSMATVVHGRDRGFRKRLEGDASA